MPVLIAARKCPLVLEGRKIRFSLDYSNHAVKRRQAFHQAMNSARGKGLDFFLLYPATLKIKDGTQYRAFTSPTDAEDYVAQAASHSFAAVEITEASDSTKENAVEEVQD